MQQTEVRDMEPLEKNSLANSRRSLVWMALGPVTLCHFWVKDLEKFVPSLMLFVEHCQDCHFGVCTTFHRGMLLGSSVKTLVKCWLSVALLFWNHNKSMFKFKSYLLDRLFKKQNKL